MPKTHRHAMAIKIVEERKDVRTEMARLISQFMKDGSSYKEAFEYAKDFMMGVDKMNANKEANEIAMDAKKANARRDEEAKQAKHKLCMSCIKHEFNCEKAFGKIGKAIKTGSPIHVSIVHALLDDCRLFPFLSTLILADCCCMMRLRTCLPLPPSLT